MFKILFVLVSTLILHGPSIEVSGDNPNLWPFVEQQFSDWQVQSPINIKSQYAYNVNLTSLLYYRYWREDNSVQIKIGIKKKSLYISNKNKIRAHITGGPLFEKKYLFSRMYIHWNTEGKIGSEHQINSQGYTMEVQMVHFKREYKHYKNAKRYPDGICIISYFGKLSDGDNPLMSDFMTAVQSIQITGSTYILSTFNTHFKWLVDLAKNYCYYVYPGSITKPPFNQCVTWVVYENTFSISQAQLNILRSLIGINGQPLTSIKRRMIQPFNNRPLCHV
ncbi:unnamed protein product [Aphis gossypii]|uniref:Alpha-carbonic anhydrase domain-containing protein n=1 Tax=Aphis gossypii TaxID=80765 RepID=A0A9P0IMR5_APHGO|nr:unnamed protein product [Aphis gossypii]